MAAAMARLIRFEVRSLLVLALAFLVGGCFYEKRPARTQEELAAAREKSDADASADIHTAIGRLMQRTKAQHDDYVAHRRDTPPVLDILIISGGGDWGAFGAGFLKGWEKVPADQPLAMPDFSVVTGVSTGSLIAPFAFLGDPASVEQIDHLYRNPKSNWVKKRGTLYFWPSNISFADIPGLEAELKKNVTPDLVKRIADRGSDGRMLLMSATDLDDETPHVFDIVTEARRATETGNLDRIHNIMLASAGIPAVFPYRLIDGVMYVDGGVTGNITYGGRMEEEDSFWAVWQKTYPDLPIPKVRYWVIFNNQFRPPPTVTEPNWPAIMQRALETGSRASTLTALRHLMAIAEIARLKRHAEVEVRVVSIPPDWIPPKPGVFVKETMNNLADVGLRMGADPSSWQTDLP